MTTSAYINNVSHYLPPTSVENGYLEKKLGLRDGWIEKKTGILSRGVMTDYCGPNAELEMSSRLFEKFLEDHPTVDPGEIDCIINATSQHSNHEPVGFWLANKYEQLNNPTCFNMYAGCTGAMLALNIAKSHILAGVYKNILILNAETILHSGWDSKSPKVSVLFGEGASAMLVSSKPTGFEIGEFVSRSDSEKMHLTESDWAPQEGDTFFDMFAEYNDEFNSLTRDQKVRINSSYGVMNGQGVYMFVLKHIPVLMDEILKANAMEKDDVEWFIPHQANKIMNDGLAARYSISPERYVSIVQDTGNISSAGCIVGLSQYQGKMSKDETVLLFAFGHGLTSCGTVLRKV